MAVIVDKKRGWEKVNRSDPTAMRAQEKCGRDRNWLDSAIFVV